MAGSEAEELQLRVFRRDPPLASTPQGSPSRQYSAGIPLSPVLFLVYMAPILEEMERRVKVEVGRVKVYFPSYVDDLHCGLYDSRRPGDRIDQRERIQDLVVRAPRVVNEVAGEHGLPLATDKQKSIVLRGREGRKKSRNGLVEKVKCLRVILNERLEFAEHWRYRMERCDPFWGRWMVWETRDGERFQ